ncbi:MAG: hypothetical protein WBD22_03270 [Pyrinomonadaceae bacterium]
MKRIKSLVALFAFSLMIIALPAVASAQWYPDNRRNRDDDYYGNSRYNRNIKSTVQNLKNRSKNFAKRVDNINDRRDDRREDRRDDRYDPWGNGRDRRDDRYNNRENLEELAERFRDATEDLADEYGNGRNLNNSRDEAQRVLQLGSQIDSALYSARGNSNVRAEWNRISSDLRVISNAYGYNYNDRNNRNNRNTGDWRNRIPFPLPF